jgi:hypothetical protein
MEPFSFVRILEVGSGITLGCFSNVFWRLCRSLWPPWEDLGRIMHPWWLDVKSCFLDHFGVLLRRFFGYLGITLDQLWQTWTRILMYFGDRGGFAGCGLLECRHTFGMFFRTLFHKFDVANLVLIP